MKRLTTPIHREGTRGLRRFAPISVGVALGFCLLFASGAGAEPLFPGSIEPAVPSPHKQVRATLYVPGCSFSGPRIASTEIIRDGFDLKAKFEVLEDFGCSALGDIKTEVPFEVNFGRLPPGHYTLEHVRELIPFGSPVVEEVLTFGISGATCRTQEGPGATLVVPYFEVDLQNPEGKSTAVSINNADDEPVVARVALWTDWASPVLSFDLYLEANDVQTFNLRQILTGGILPVTGADLDPETFPGCSSPLKLPFLSGADLARMRARLSGQPDPDDGLCYGRGDDGVAVGFITVDALNDCSNSMRYPTSSGYFAPGGTGLASNRNVLWGDILYVDPESNSAQGLKALTFPAVEHDGGRQTLYGRQDDRNPLPIGYRTRYFKAGDFAGGSELLLWTPQFISNVAAPCGTPFAHPVSSLIQSVLRLEIRSGNEDGGDLQFRPPFQLPAVAYKLPMDLPDLQLEDPFGVLSFTFNYYTNAPITPPGFRIQGFAAPLLRADDRYSVGLEAVETVSFCNPFVAP